MFTKNQIQVLALFMSQSQKEYCLSEIAQIFGKKPGVFQKGLYSLERDGILVSHRSGNRRLFRINQDYPLLNELRNIIQKTVGVEGLLKKLVEKIKGISIAFIFGSYAKNMIQVHSDIDVVIVGDSTAEDHFLDGLTEIENRIQREVNYRFYTKTEFNNKKQMKDPFLMEIISDQIVLLKGMI